MSDLDLYDDLPDLNFGESVSKIDEENEHFKKQLNEKDADLLKTKERIAHLEKKNKILEENISSLYQTAVNEIQRKDQLIQELRREKESLIFRRESGQNRRIKSTGIVSSSSLDNNFHQIYDLPAKPIPSVESAGSSSVNTEVKKSLETKCHGEFSSNNSFEYESSIQCIPISLTSDQVQENEDAYSRGSDVIANVAQSSTKTLRNKSSEIIATLYKLSVASSHSSQTSPRFPHRSGSTEYSHETVSKNEMRPLFSEEKREKHKRRENREIQKGYYSDKHSYSRSMHRSLCNTSRSSKLLSKRNRKDRSWDDRKYLRNLHKGIELQEPESNLEIFVEPRRKHHLHSRSPSPQRSRCFQNPVRSDKRCLSSKVKALSDNVRVATQLKSKYSKARRERSVSCTPVKQQTVFQEEPKLESCSRPLESKNVSCNLFPKLNLEDRFASKGHDCESKLSNIVKSTESLTKYCSSDTFGKNCRVTLSEDFEKSSLQTVDQCDYVQRKENDCAVLDNSCLTYQIGNTKKGESLEFNEKMEDTEHNSLAQSDGFNDKIYRNTSFQIECEARLNRDEKSVCEKLPLQQLRTPPSKNLIPLKISPSFEDPAIFKENKFSFCVFNEQCEFKRHKRKRSVKLLGSEGKDVCISERSKKNNIDDYNCESDVDMKQKMNLYQKGNNGKVIKYQNQPVLNHDKSVSEIANKSTVEENEQGTSKSSKNSIHIPHLENLNIKKLSAVEVLKTKSPNKKRKLDTICEELKANLEKKNVNSPAEYVSDDEISNIDKPSKLNNTPGEGKQSTSTVVNSDISECSNIANDVNLIESPKCIIISKRRRKVCNLQDNMVQVISQIKSRLS